MAVILKADKIVREFKIGDGTTVTALNNVCVDIEEG